MMRLFLNKLIRLAATLLILALFWTAALPQSALGAPLAPEGKKPANPPAKPLFILVTFYPDDPVCVGDTVNFMGSVMAGIGLPVPNATIMVNGKRYTSDRGGDVRWTDVAKEEGEKQWAITATKAGYTPASPSNLTEKVIACSWKIGLDYDDTYIDPESGWVFQSSVELPDYVPFVANSDGTLGLTQSALTAQYHGNFYLLLKPFECSVQPELSGIYQIQFSGTYKKQVLTIQLSASSVDLPPEVTLQCVDNQGVYQIKPIKYITMRKMDLVNEAAPKLTKVTFKKNGGAIKFRVSHALIWPVPSKEMGGVLVVVSDNKGSGN